MALYIKICHPPAIGNKNRSRDLKLWQDRRSKVFKIVPGSVVAIRREGVT